MKTKIFERELKALLNYVRAYGIQHMSKKIDVDILKKDETIQNEFVKSVHKGFYLAQRNCVLLLRKVLQEKKLYKADLKNARRIKDNEKIEQYNRLINEATYQEMVLRKAMDSIAWQIFDMDISKLRRLYYGQELIDITDSNIESEIRFVDEYIKKNKESFVLISDMTSFIKISDVVICKPGEKIFIGELKERDTNAKIFDLLKEGIENPCPYYLFNKLENETAKFRKQFKRDIKQIERAAEISKVFNEGEGEDLLTGKSVKIYSDEIVLGSYDGVVENLLKECDKKGYAISVVEGCLLIGVYKASKFPTVAFDVWAKGLNIEMPIIDFRQSFFDPLAFPIFLQSFPENYILDIIMGRKIVKLTLDISKWLEIFEENGCSYRWMSKKETARVNGELKGKVKIFTLNNCGIELKNEKGTKQYLGEGIFSRMFTSLNTPISLVYYLKTTMEYSEE